MDEYEVTRLASQKLEMCQGKVNLENPDYEITRKENQRLDKTEPAVALEAKAAKTAPASGTNVGGIPPGRVTPGYKGRVSRGTARSRQVLAGSSQGRPTYGVTRLIGRLPSINMAGIKYISAMSIH